MKNLYAQGVVAQGKLQNKRKLLGFSYFMCIFVLLIQKNYDNDKTFQFDQF